ncbi:MAG TPA: polysaccharide deacetylase family protein [Polyangiales bacterium]|nr:polysaccharide deacetylase family protein [Polyangiales bacterium]
MKLAAVSVDIDEIDNYAAIYGLSGALDVSLTAVYDKALPRLGALFAELDVPCTFFAIGRDLTRAENVAQLRALHAAGHEIANHSLNHYYDLTRRDRNTQQREVRGGADAIEAAVGARPVGFRAPGYTITDQLFEVLAGEAVRYDSSVFPCPPYYLAKAAAIGLIKARGRQSRSVVDDPRVLSAPAEPYYVGRPYYRRGAGLREFPIGVSGDWSMRLPYIGTTVALAGERGARWLTRLASRSFVNLELHGIDLSDAHEDGLRGLVPYQQDLRRSAAEKRLALASALSELKRQGYTFVTLAEATRRLAA